ncbi:MAG: TolC family protein [Bacteroidales bacterium]
MKSVKSIRIAPLALLIFLFTGTGFAQEGKATIVKPVSIQDYLKEVAQGNLGYIAEKFNIDIAEATVKAAKVFNNPEIAVGYSDNQDRRIQMGKSFDAGLSYSLNLGNVRSARISVAQSERDLSGLVLQTYFQNLRADAALVYYTGLKEKLLLGVQEDNYQRMVELARADSIRFRTGTIMEVDARQSAIEVRIQKNELIRARSAWQVALVQMERLRGISGSDTSWQPSGSLEYPIRDFTAGSLIDQAKENRYDLQAAIQLRTISEKMVRLVKSGRAMELGIQTGMSFNTIAVNEIAPSPAHYSYNIGVSVPLKFSSLNKGELEAWELTVKQKEVACRDAEQIVISEVTRAFILYQSQKRQLEEFHAGLLAEAETILNSKVYSYKRGETSLLDVLIAQRTYNGIKRSFYETHYGYLEALIELERASGIWDI